MIQFNHLVFGANDVDLDLADYTAAQIELAFTDPLNLPPEIEIYIDGWHVEDRDSFVIQWGQRIEFMKESGFKSIGEPCTKEHFCRSFHVSPDEWDECLARGLATAKLRHEVVLLVSEGVRCLEAVRSSVAADLSKLNATEKAILDALGSSKLTGQEIADRAGRHYNSNFKSELSAMRRFGILRHDERGYFKA